MTRAEAIRRLESIATNLTGACVEAQSDKVSEYIARKIQAVDMAIAALREQDVTDINVGNKWISVKEQLPKYGVPVLVADTRDGFVSMFSLEKRPNNKSFWFNGEDWWLDQEEITHWMPLPQPPKEE